ncbi:response regulator transcription factor [Daejeonella sp.]|uniref:response regulator transcription factor n=1 Tax=Daejeonella sp. TaxID=2805397 RepID=UPI002731A8AB|nr:response regulator transcription factor [Daejeonella sp.]MDP2414263.1 response regulator transcription factor [Daejeonella sp.]
MKILIIEDEPSLRESIITYFTGEGNICEAVANHSAAIEKIHLYDYDCILLDLNLPGGDGMTILSELKRINKKDGVLIISARNSLDDKLAGLNVGADDYLVKPFHLSELQARVTAIVRRKNFDGNNFIVFNEIKVNTVSKNVTINGRVLTLTRKEYELLIYFLANKGKVISKTAIAEHLWGDEMDLIDRHDFIYTHIKNLRRKLIESGSLDYIKSMYGVGYKFGDL